MPLVLNKDTFKKIKEDNIYIKTEKDIIMDELLNLGIVNDENTLSKFCNSTLGFYFTGELPITYTMSLESYL